MRAIVLNMIRRNPRADWTWPVVLLCFVLLCALFVCGPVAAQNTGTLVAGIRWLLRE